MIIKAFSEYLQNYNSAEIPSVTLLSIWLMENLSKNPENKIEKIIHNEMGLLKKQTRFVFTYI